MIFTTLDFLLFFILYNVGALFFARKQGARYFYLTAASFVFYGWWDWRFLFLIIFSGMIDFTAAFFMSGKYRKWALAISISGNLFSLAVFKYANFIADNINYILSHTAYVVTVPEFHLILPVGISFYTFQSMSYSIDVYRGKLTPVKSVWLFFSYLSMFPQLVAGPIVRAVYILDQIRKPLSVSPEVIYQGLRLIVWGLFLKMVVADTLGPIVDRNFASELSGDSPGNMWHWWLIITLFALQIYCDFNGYSLIAIGLARWMGFKFLANFNHPYLAYSFKDFWARWHISLSTWFRDYVYIPLGGNRSSQVGQYFNLWVTMLLSGLWHGASWNFLIWGGLHSFYLSIERLIGWNPKRKPLKMLAPIVIFPAVLIAWVFFRAEDLETSMRIITQMFSFATPDMTALKLAITVKGFFVCAVLFLAETVQYFMQHGFLGKSRFAPIEPAILGVLLAFAIFFRGVGGDFIYFQF